MGADFTQEFDIVQISQPVCVIGNDAPPSPSSKLMKRESCFLMQATLWSMVSTVIIYAYRFAGGVANHACAATHQADGAVAAALHVRHSHNGQEMPNVQAVRGGVDADIEGDTAFFKSALISSSCVSCSISRVLNTS